MKGWLIGIIVVIGLFIIIGLTKDMDKTDYHFDIQYLDGTKEHKVIHARNSFIRPELHNGCLGWSGSSADIVCGVKSFTWYKVKMT